MNMKNPTLVFDKCIEIANDVGDLRILEVKNRQRKEESSYVALKKESLKLMPGRYD